LDDFLTKNLWTAQTTAEAIAKEFNHSPKIKKAI